MAFQYERPSFYGGAPPNQSLQRTWLSRLHLLPVSVCGRFGHCWARCLSRHAAELRSVGRQVSWFQAGDSMTQRIESTTGDMADSDGRQFQYTLRMLVLYFALPFVITWSILVVSLNFRDEFARRADTGAPDRPSHPESGVQHDRTVTRSSSRHDQ